MSSSFKDKVAKSIQEKYASPNTEQEENSTETGPTEISKHSEFFGVDNIRNSPACLDLRLSDGKFKALPYSYIVEINFALSEGIEIITAMKKILISGRNLQLLYNYLVTFRVRYIQAQIGNDISE